MTGQERHPRDIAPTVNVAPPSMHAETVAAPVSPEFEHPIEGYSDQVGVAAGTEVAIMASGLGAAELSVVRLLHGDPHPAGPGYREENPAWYQPTKLQLGHQELDLGSYIEVPDSPGLSPLGSMSVGLWIYPTRMTGGWQAIAAKWSPGEICFGLFCLGNSVLAGGVSFDGQAVNWCTGRYYLEPHTWQFVALVYDSRRGRLAVNQYCEAATTELETPRPGVATMVESATTVPSASLHIGHAPLMFGALPATGMRRHWAHFNGKLAAPFLLGEAASAAVLLEIKDEAVSGERPNLIGAWDLSREVSTSAVIDVSPNGHHGLAMNAPARAVTGPRWSGTQATVYTDTPDHYDAIHLHDDDLDNAGWEPVATVSIPADARPGVYAARLLCGHDQLTIPFVVRPPSPTAPLCVIIPTLTWQAYSSNRGPYSYTEDGVVDRALCIYDVHSDGSVVNYCTRLKPTRSGNPGRGIRQWGGHNLPADLYLIDWMEQSRISPYDVSYDQDLHQRGLELLAPYRCVVIGSHPEYWTVQMLDALEEYLRQGGRLMYLGGNGLYWVTSLDPQRPYLMEVRKSGDGDYEEALTSPAPGQLLHSTTLEVGGLWSRRGRPATRLVGIEHSANVFVAAEGRWGFNRLAASYAPQFRFIFDGVGDEVIGDFGLNLGSAAAYEMDAAHEWLFSADWRPTVLARAVHESFLSTMRLPVSRAAEIAFTMSPNGAAVFAAGSVTWTGSLSHNGYDNNVSRITGNVIRRFLDTPHGHPVTKGSLRDGP
jgi:N,N-dimethylformamidase